MKHVSFLVLGVGRLLGRELYVVSSSSSLFFRFSLLVVVVRLKNQSREALQKNRCHKDIGSVSFGGGGGRGSIAATVPLLRGGVIMMTFGGRIVERGRR